MNATQAPSLPDQPPPGSSAQQRGSPHWGGQAPCAPRKLLCVPAITPLASLPLPAPHWIGSFQTILKGPDYHLRHPAHLQTELDVQPAWLLLLQPQRSRIPTLFLETLDSLGICNGIFSWSLRVHILPSCLNSPCLLFLKCLVGSQTGHQAPLPTLSPHTVGPGISTAGCHHMSENPGHTTNHLLEIRRHGQAGPLLCGARGPGDPG